MRLVDQVSGPGRAISASLGALNRAVTGFTSATLMPSRALGAMATDMRRRVTDMTAMSATLSLGLAKVATSVYDLEKNLNKGQAAGNLSLQQRNDLLQTAIKLNYDYAATSSEIVAGANEILRSGLSYEQTIGSLNGILDTAQAMDVPISDAAAAIVNAMVSQKMAMEDMQATMKSSIRMADLFAYAMKETAGASLEDFATSGKYFNPVAAAIGMTPGQTMAYQIALAKAGIYGSSAGTGLRSAPVRVSAPTKRGREAFARLGINPEDFSGKKVRDVTGADIAAMLSESGIDADGMAAGIDQLLQDPKLRRSRAKLATAIIEQFGEDLGTVTAADRSDMADSIQRALATGLAEVDLYKVLKAMRDKGATSGDYVDVFGLHHASKMQAIDLDILKHYLESTEGEAIGTARRMREIMMQGIVKAWNQFTASLEAMSIAFGKSGLLEDATNAFNKLADVITDLSKTNPDLLRFSGYAAMALAAMAPLGLVISGVASSLAFMANPLTIVAGALGALAYHNWDFVTRSLTAFASGFLDKLDPKILDGAASAFERLKAAFSGESIKFDASWSKFFASIGSDTAQGINGIVDAILRLYNTKGVQGFIDGVGNAFSNMASAVKYLAEQASAFSGSMQPFIDFLNSDAGKAFGEFAGQMWGYGAGFVVAAAGIGMAAVAIRSMASALLALSGAKAGAAVLGALLGLVGGGGGRGKGVAAAGGGLLGRLLGGKGKGFGLGILGGGALLGGLMYLLKDYEGGVWHTKPPKQRNSALADWMEETRRKNLERRTRFVPDGPDDAQRSGKTNWQPKASNPMWELPSTAEGVAIFNRLVNESQAAGQKVQENLSIEATPVVNSAYIDAAIRKASALRAMLGGMTGGGAAAPTPGLSKFGGPRAGGGPVARGMNYLVGENGPELFTPGSNGTITPNHALGGSTTITNHINVTGGNAEEVVRKLMAKLDAQLMRSRQTNLDGRPRYEFG